VVEPTMGILFSPFRFLSFSLLFSLSLLTLRRPSGGNL
jgi:hypothetical protein